MNAAPTGRAAPPLPMLLLAFACLYLIWGTTYLGIRFAIETMPPLLMVGVRYVIAGAILYLIASSRSDLRRPTAAEWRAAAFYGSLFFLMGNGGVSWSEQRISSGITALLVAAVPLWITLFDALRRGGQRPTPLAVAGLVLGFSGIAFLIGPGTSLTRSAIDPAAAVVMMLATLGWAYGTAHARHAPHPPSLLQTSAMQMLMGGMVVMLVGSALGEWRAVHLGAISARSLWAFGYLIVFGSVVAFSAFAWLLRVTTPARVGTYAFVNPIVAVLAGWALGGEAVTTRTLVAGSIVVLGVVLILRARARASVPAAIPSAPGTAGVVDL